MFLQYIKSQYRVFDHMQLISTLIKITFGKSKVFWKGALLRLGRGKRMKDSNAANISAPPYLITEEAWIERFSKRKDMHRDRSRLGGEKWKTGALKRWDLSKWRNYIKLCCGVTLSCCSFSQSKHGEVSRQDRARLGRLKSATQGLSCRKLSYLFTG